MNKIFVIAVISLQKPPSLDISRLSALLSFFLSWQKPGRAARSIRQIATSGFRSPLILFARTNRPSVVSPKVPLPVAKHPVLFPRPAAVSLVGFFFFGHLQAFFPGWKGQCRSTFIVPYQGDK